MDRVIGRGIGQARRVLQRGATFGFAKQLLIRQPTIRNGRLNFSYWPRPFPFSASLVFRSTPISGPSPSMIRVPH